MIDASLVSTLLCFVYTLRYYYTLSGTNLLTRCRSASCLFSAIFGFRKAKNEYSRNWMGQNPKSLFFRSKHGAGRIDGGGPGGGHTLGWRGSPVRTSPRCGPLEAPQPCPFAYIYVSPRLKP